LSLSSVFAQRIITGKVIDNTGTALAGVSVSAKGAKIGTTTNSSGDFSLTITAKVKALIFTSIGFEANEVPLSENNNTLSVQMQVAVTESENVIVTGYTREKASKYSGSAAKVSAEKINQIPNASLDQILQGRAPGLYSVAGSGQPGAAATVLIRGAGSISGVTAPLYVMDGILLSPAYFNHSIHHDIESVDVLKDASSTALYGSSGANGYIVITTKRGKAGKAVYSVKSQLDLQTGQAPN
jgi:TonB-dependent SusC/RagA subfamily outer membrane receptor